MKNKTIVLFVIIALMVSFTGLSAAFYVLTLDARDNFLEKANSIMEFMETTGIKSDPLLICTGGLSNASTLNIFSETQPTNPVEEILKELNTKCITPPSDELDSSFLKAIKSQIPVVVSDSSGNGFASFLQVDFGGTTIGIFNITEIPSDWYENVRGQVDLFALDSIIIIMDNPELKIVPAEIRSRTFVIPRNTAVYRVDIEYGPLLTEVNLTQSEQMYPIFGETKELYADWLNHEYTLDPHQLTRWREIPFYSMIGLMALKDSKADLMFYYNPDLPETITTQEAINRFSHYVMGTVNLENKNIRKLLLRSAAMIDYDGFDATINETGNYYSLYGEPYFVDLSKIPENRLIISTFKEPQKILVFGPEAIVKENFPFMKTSTLSPLYYVFWALKGGYPDLSPNWRVTAQPYLYTYTIEKGDTLNIIAEKLGITVSSIKAFNPDLIEMYLTPGTHIYVHIPYEFEKQE
ncbi:MAG TPA: LysM domain-containing protein [Thermotogota bacterium]|nr:LysM domain-containing protein [Thermotogota bacterium]HPJ89583.1 LysM domain-containing protein [Thermotogota bacterium]HPR97071.1 LysM domain-containing protein [Thermotogota bacterium]